MNQILKLGVAACLMFGVNATAENAKDIQLGDAVNGGKVYRMHCAACHGVGGDGDGVLSANYALKPLRNGSFFFSKPMSFLLDSMSKGGKNTPETHGQNLSSMDLRDVLVWLQQPIPTLKEFFPGASDYLSFEYVLDTDGQDRASKLMGAPVADADKNGQLYVLFKPAPPAEGETAKPATQLNYIPTDDLIQLNDAKPKRKMGYVMYLPFRFEGNTIMGVITMNPKLTILDARLVVPTSEKALKTLKQVDPIVRQYAGSAGGDEKKLPESKGAKASKEIQAQMLRAYALIVEGSAMYQKDEKNRFWSDPDAFKVEIADQPQDLKFDMKQGKKK